MSESNKDHLWKKFTELVEESKRFTEQLLKENEQLRLQLAAYKSDADKLELTAEVEHLRKMLADMEAEKNKLHSELQSLRDTLRSVEEENRFYANKYVEIERRNSDLASLYVASYRMQSALTLKDALTIISEIVVAMIGSEEFAVYLFVPQQQRFYLAACEGGKQNFPSEIPEDYPLVALVLESGRSWTRTDEVKDDAANPEDFIAIVPLKVGNKKIGFIGIKRLLVQKSGFNSQDFEMFEFLAVQAAKAVLSASLFELYGKERPFMVEALRNNELDC